ncbi:MAG TPA: divalent metal cation transporter [Tepidisphaeraceae bacterium]|nr:divalent metal cation transporter [Tepidisphaeraceae bacterium]
MTDTTGVFAAKTAGPIGAAKTAENPASTCPADPSPQKKTSFFKRLGPGLITGASDDDPSGIATYSQAGAAYGYDLLWTLLLTLPLMAAIQEIAARIGRVTGRGIAGNMRRHYSAWLLYPVISLLVIVNTINLGADIGAMGDAVKLLVGGPALVYAAILAIISVLLQVFASYPRCTKFMKWLTLALFSYVVSVFIVHLPWGQALWRTIVPHWSFSGDYWATVIALLGTTISPYLFFWQASQETEEIRANGEQKPLKREPCQAPLQLERIRLDTYVGMTFSNLVAYCIILAAAATLHGNGITEINTSADAAKALEPVAGRFAFVIFAIGIVGTGMLAVPVLAGSAAYGVGEALKWRTGLDQKPRRAKGFYGVLTAATFIGLALNVPAVQHVTHLSPIKALFWAAVINGVVAVPIMVVMMLMFHNGKVMGEFAKGSRGLKVLGWISTAAMFVASLGLFLTWKS